MSSQPSVTIDSDEAPYDQRQSSRLIGVIERHRPNFEPFEDIYRQVHQDPELSEQENRTANLVAHYLKSLGFTVKESIGGHGVAGVLQNGPGKVVLLRAELDALPMREQTDLPFASKKNMNDSWGQEQPVMHACGHDMHMACLLATCKLLQDAQADWSGTLVAVFQPNEEHLGGAQTMLEDGLYKKIPVPDVAFAQHGMEIKSGMISIKPGPVLVSADTVRIRLFASYGYKANPQIAADPVRTASKIISQLDDLIEDLGRGTYAAIRIDEIHAGQPGLDWVDHVDLVFDIKTFDQDLRARLHKSLTDLVQRESKASGAQQEPEIHISERAQMTKNDDLLVQKLKTQFLDHFGAVNLTEQLPEHPVEDFSKLATVHEVPYVFWWIGRVDPVALDDAEKHNEILNRIGIEHSPFNTLVLQPTMKVGTDAMSMAALLFLLNDDQQRSVELA